MHIFEAHRCVLSWEIIVADNCEVWPSTSTAVLMSKNYEYEDRVDEDKDKGIRVESRDYSSVEGLKLKLCLTDDARPKFQCMKGSMWRKFWSTIEAIDVLLSPYPSYAMPIIWYRVVSEVSWKIWICLNQRSRYVCLSAYPTLQSKTIMLQYALFHFVGQGDIKAITLLANQNLH